MLHVQSLGKRKAYAISETGAVTEDAAADGGGGVASSALWAVRSMRPSLSLSSREMAAISVKKAVIELHGLLDVVSTLRNNDILTTQICSRPLSALPVGLQAKCSTEQAVTLKSAAFSSAASLLTRAVAESSKSVEERRAYARGCTQLRKRWQLTLQTPGGQASAQQRHDAARANCSFSSCGGKYSGDAWSETLLVGSNGPTTQKRGDAMQVQYTLEISIQHKQYGLMTSVKLWDLLAKEKCRAQSSTSEFQENLAAIEYLFHKVSHDCLCRELFDGLNSEVLRSGAHGQVVSEINSAPNSQGGSIETAAALQDLFNENLTSSLQIVHLSRMKISLLLSTSCVLQYCLVEIPSHANAFDSSSDPTDGLKDQFGNVLLASISTSLLTSVAHVVRIWEGRSGDSSENAAQKENYRSDQKSLLSTKKLTQFHITKFRLDQHLLKIKKNSKKDYALNWVEEPDSAFRFQRKLLLHVSDMIFEITVDVNSMAVLCSRCSTPSACLETPQYSARRTLITNYDGSNDMNIFFSNMLLL